MSTWITAPCGNDVDLIKEDDAGAGSIDCVKDISVQRADPIEALSWACLGLRHRSSGLATPSGEGVIYGGRIFQVSNT